MYTLGVFAFWSDILTRTKIELWLSLSQLAITEKAPNYYHK